MRLWESVQLLPVVFSFLLLAAHFLRMGLMPLAAGAILFPALLLIRKAGIAKLFQMVLVLGTIEWLRTGTALVSMRQQNHEPWARLAVILGGVAFLTFASSFVFFSKTLKKRYRHQIFINPS